MNSTECSICGKKVKFMKYDTVDHKTVCSDCFKCCELGLNFNKSLFTYDFVLNAVNNKKNQIEVRNNFVATKKISSYLYLDEEKQLWLIPDPMFGRIKNSTPYRFSDIVDFELLEDGQSIAKGGLGRSIVGAISFGPAGAIVGGVTANRKTKKICTSLKIKITLNSMKNPYVYIDFLQSLTAKTDSMYYKTIYNSAQECLSTLQLICNANKVSDTPTIEYSAADEILKLKNLMDMGIISKEVFEEKKEILLKKI